MINQLVLAQQTMTFSAPRANSQAATTHCTAHSSLTHSLTHTLPQTNEKNLSQGRPLSRSPGETHKAEARTPRFSFLSS